MNVEELTEIDILIYKIISLELIYSLSIVYRKLDTIDLQLSALLINKFNT